MTTEPSNPSQDYQAYLLRLWRDTAQGPWRASLQAVGDEQARAFRHLDALFRYLEGRAPEEDSAGGNPDAETP